MKTATIEIVDHGRGPQLSTKRTTVMDVYYWIHRGYDFDFIHEEMPFLTRQELDVLEAYVNTHREELIERDRRAEEWVQQKVAEQQARGGIFAPLDETVPKEERIARLREKMLRQKAEKNREGNLD